MIRCEVCLLVEVSSAGCEGRGSAGAWSVVVVGSSRHGRVVGAELLGSPLLVPLVTPCHQDHNLSQKEEGAGDDEAGVG